MCAWKINLNRLAPYTENERSLVREVKVWQKKNKSSNVLRPVELAKKSVTNNPKKP